MIVGATQVAATIAKSTFVDFKKTTKVVLANVGAVSTANISKH